jgi:hypothetical protein
VQKCAPGKIAASGFEKVALSTAYSIDAVDFNRNWLRSHYVAV